MRTHPRDMPTSAKCWPLLFLLCSGCAAAGKADTAAASTEATHCFVLPGAGSEATKSYRVLEGGGLEEAGEVSGGAMHMRATFHPDGRTLYVSSAGPAGWEPYALGDSLEGGIHVRAYAYDPADCSIGRLLGTGRMGGEEPDNNRVYGLEVHPNGHWLYQTTSSLRRIRLFDIPEDRVPVPRYAFDVTSGGTHVCVQLRRLSMHASGRYLYANCNNGDGIEDALQAWAIEPDGSITLLDHYTFPAMNGGVYDPVIHPSGDWLYQPVGTTSPDAPAGSGAYVLVYRVDDDGRLALRDRVAVRTATAADSVEDPTSVMIQPSTVVLHPDGSTLYITLGVILAVPAPEPEDFAHEFAVYRIEDGGARLTERARMPALRETAFSTHGGATLAGIGGELFLYSYLTDYDTIQGGVLQRLRITEDQSLEPLDPPWVSTGLFDGRQPIPMPANGRAGPAAAPASATQAHESAVSSAAVIAPVLDGGRLLLEIRPRGVGRLFFVQSYNAEPVPDLAWRNEPGSGGYFRLVDDDSVLVLEQLDFDAAPTDASRGVPAVTAVAVLPILRRESGTGLLVVDGSDLFLDPLEAYRWAVWGVEFGPFDPSVSELLRASSSDVSFNIHVTHTFAVPGDSGSMAARPVRVAIAYRALLLPETPATPRPCDPQIGVWHRPNPRAGDENACMIYHRPLTTADSDRTPSRPTEPIVYYIDPDTPGRWVPWVMRGVEMWEPAFRAAGWHDAIQARLPPTPEEDPDFDVYDLRHSVIYWNPWNDYAWGSHWSDPRSGEILRGAGRIGGGYARSVHSKVWAEAGAAEDGARSLPMPDSLLGFELAGLVAHEVGHTLGLGHNLAASSYVPVDSLHSRSFTCSEGLAPTVMDYTPNNYVAQPGDGACTRSRRMGFWDYEVIRWLYGRTESSRSGVGTASGAIGPYRWTPPGSGSAGAQPFDHRTVLHTLGDDPIRATAYGLANIERLAGALPLYGLRDSAGAAEAIPNAAELFERLVLTWQRQLDHVVALVGDPNVEPSRQREAVRFLLEHAFAPPRFLLTDELTAVLPQPPAQVVGEAQRTLLGSLLSEGRLAHLDSLERAGRTDFGTDELMADLSARLLEPDRPAGAGDDALQRALVEFYMERRRSLRLPDAPIRPDPRGL